MFTSVPDGVTVSATGTSSQTFNFVGTPTQRGQWQTFFYDFTVTSANTTIALAGSSASNGSYIGLDNVTLAQTGSVAVPESGSLALLLPALGVLGAVIGRNAVVTMRRRK